MTSEGELVEELQELIKNLIPASFTGKVIEGGVDEAKGIVTVLFDELEHDVKLKSIVDEKEFGIFLIPEEGSDVFCVPEGLDQERYFAAGMNTIAKIIIKMQNLDFVMDNVAKSFKVTNGNTMFELTDALAQFNGGNNGGLTKTPELKSNLDKNNDILNAVIQVCQTPITEPGNGAPSAFQAALKTALTGKMVGDFSSIENDKVKH